MWNSNAYKFVFGPSNALNFITYLLCELIYSSCKHLSSAKFSATTSPFEIFMSFKLALFPLDILHVFLCWFLFIEVKSREINDLFRTPFAPCLP